MLDRKDADENRRAKKSLDLSSIGINSAVLINDSLIARISNCGWINLFIVFGLPMGSSN